MKKLYTIILLAFIVIIANAQYTKLLDFSGTNGSTPNGSLIKDGIFLYGMTQLGGANSKGTIFKIKPDGTEYAKLNDFSGESDGSNPWGSLISDGTFMYGMTNIGGTYSSGVIFKILSGGTGFYKLFDFLPTVFSGRNPRSSLISVGTHLYGMTYYGGTNNLGAIFTSNGNSTLFNFSGYDDGRNPEGSLISDGTFLYGMTSSGGTNNNGVIFKIMPTGTGYFPLHYFAGSPTDGSNPRGDLVSDGIFLYGMTYQGGTNGLGVIFKIKPDGTGYAKLLDFVGTANGSYPSGSLISDGTFLYGMTSSGGISNLGTIFKIKPDGTGYSKLLDFSGTANGSTPNGSLISDGTFLYGMTNQGGTNNIGTIFKYYLICTLTVTCNISPSSTVCAGTSVTLTGSGASTYIWTGGVTDGISFVPSATNTYTVTGTDANGCSATSSATVTVNPLPTIPTITANGTTLTSNSAIGNQWYLNGNIINGATSQNYLVTQNGNYTVVVTVNGCSATSVPYNFITVSISDLAITNSILIIPNPNNGIFRLETKNLQFLKIKIYNTLGETIYESENRNSEIDLSVQPKGTYFINVYTQDKTYSKTLIIQ